MFECKVCEEKQARIQDLQLQLIVLQRLVFPTYTRKSPLPVIDTETGAELQVEMTQAPEFDPIALEAANLLSGNY